METPKEYYYTYYSYEEWGRGYFGSRKCKCLPEEDVNYFGSSKDKSFKPKYKIILKSDYNTREEAYADEIILQQHYKVVENPHFANRAYQTSTKFYVPKEQSVEVGRRNGERNKKFGLGICNLPKEDRIKTGKIAGKKGGKRTKELGVGLFSLTKEQRQEHASKMGKLTYELGTGIHALTIEQRREIGKKAGQKTYELGIGVHSLTPEQRSENGKKSAETNKKNKTGLYGITPEQRRENNKKISSQKWMCLETGHISTPGGLGMYQKARGIDTTKRVRIA